MQATARGIQRPELAESSVADILLAEEIDSWKKDRAGSK